MSELTVWSSGLFGIDYDVAAAKAQVAADRFASEHDAPIAANIVLRLWCLRALGDEGVPPFVTMPGLMEGEGYSFDAIVAWPGLSFDWNPFDWALVAGALRLGLQVAEQEHAGT